MKCIKYELGQKDKDGRASIREIPNSEYTVTCDQVIYAISSNANNIATKDTDILHMKNGLIFTNDYQTTVDNIYAGGDNITGPMTVIKAMEAGRKSAKLIDSQLK
jgi:glutamate synthase (NADPH/NADH) small chain